MKGRKQLMSSAKTDGKDEWLTPPCVLDRVRRIGEIGLDPCTNHRNPVGALFYYTATPEDGDESQSGLGDWIKTKNESLLVFVNPPYSAMRAWAAKVAAEAKEGRRIISLVPARTDTQAWATLVEGATSVAFWRGRIEFIDADTGEYSHGAPFPSAVVAHNVNRSQFNAAFGDVAWVVTP